MSPALVGKDGLDRVDVDRFVKVAEAFAFMVERSNDDLWLSGFLFGFETAAFSELDSEYVGKTG